MRLQVIELLSEQLENEELLSEQLENEIVLFECFVFIGFNSVKVQEGVN